MGMGPGSEKSPPEKSPEGDHMAGPKLVPSKEGISPEASPIKQAGIIMVMGPCEKSKLVIPSGILLLMAPESWVPGPPCCHEFRTGIGAMAEVDVGENEVMAASEKPEEA